MQGALDSLASQHDVLVAPAGSCERPGGLAALLDGVEALISLLSVRVDDTIFDVGKDLRVVANYAVGVDNIDLVAAARRRVIVTNTPLVLVEATADLCVGALLALSRRLIEGDRLVRSGAWRGWEPTQLLGVGLQGKRIGIVGMGAIGQAVARRAQAFGMRVCYHHRRFVPNLPGEALALDELLEQADVVSLHLPLTAQTRHMIGAAQLGRMKRTALLINTARGAVIDEVALVEALQGGWIAGAALDVYEHEPSLAAGLLQAPNTLLLPHIGSATFETRLAMGRLCADNVLAVLAGREPPNRVV